MEEFTVAANFQLSVLADDEAHARELTKMFVQWINGELDLSASFNDEGVSHIQSFGVEEVFEAN